MAVAWTAGPVHAEDAPAAGSDPPAVGIAEVQQDEVTLRVYPTRISADRTRSFDRRGHTNGRSNRLSVNLQADITTGRTVLASRNGRVEQVRDEKGQALPLPKGNTRYGTGWSRVRTPRRGGDEQPDANVSFNASLGVPEPHVRMLAEVSGRIELLVTDADLRVVRLAPLSEFLGKRLRIRDMEDAAMMVERVGENGAAALQIAMSDDRMLQVKDVRFFSAEGRRLPGGEASRERSYDDVKTRAYRDAPPDTATVEIEVYPSAERVDIPWTLRNLPLPAVADDVADVTVETRPLAPSSRPTLEVEVEADPGD